MTELKGYRIFDKETLTYGEMMQEAIAVKTHIEASMFKTAYVDWMMKSFEGTREEAEEQANKNLGYIAYYYDEETCKRVLDLFQVKHPGYGRESS